MTTDSTLPNPTEIWQQTCSWQPDETQQARFEQVYRGIVAGNRQLNLTRIVAPWEFWEKHLWDSVRGIVPLKLLSSPEPQPLSMIDIGTGAGFPGLAIAIAAPQTQVLLLDATHKKIAFLQGLCQQLALPNITCLAERAEPVGQQQRDRYDLAVLRAVGGVTVCAEYAFPLLKIGGMAVLYRGHLEAEEKQALAIAASKLGGKIEAIEEFQTPLTHGIRHCIYLNKVARTPKCYPRAVGVPAKKPL